LNGAPLLAACLLAAALVVLPVVLVLFAEDGPDNMTVHSAGEQDPGDAETRLAALPCS